MPGNRSPIVIGIIIFLSDRIFKRLSTIYLSSGDIEFGNGLLRLTHVKNPGAAFGLFPSQRGLIIFVSLLALIFILRLFRRVGYNNSYFIYGLWSLVFGILGNLYDRVFLGHVIDYIQILNSPIFNLSDIAIIIGMIMILFSS
ncbi:MAG TPA: signal peptidase II [bacterium]|nr:signal peptidase II [bacterium]